MSKKQTRKRKHVGPVNRNYKIDLHQPYKRTIFNYDGSVRSVQSITASHRAAALTVNNPWRQQKPSVLTPTARTLEYSRVENAISNVETLTNGRRTVTEGPHVDVMASEWNRRYLSPSYGANDEQLRTEAILEALQAVKDQKWNAGVSIAESAGVAKMAVDAMNLIIRTRNGIRNAEYGRVYEEFRRKVKAKPYPTWRRENWQKIRHIKSIRESKHIPSGWLYYHFGIKPTLDEIESAMYAYQTRFVDPIFLGALFTKGYSKQTTKVTEKQSTGLYSGTMEYTVLRSVRVKIGVRPKNFALSKLSELGVTNPPDAVWNAIPFSWLVDYFTSFGDWLNVLDTSLGWDFADKWEECWRVVATSKFTPQSSASVKYGYPQGPCLIRHKKINRVVRGDLYGPMGSILPQFKRKGPSVQQISNLLSVLATSMRIPIRP